MTDHQIATAVLLGIAAAGLFYIALMSAVMLLTRRPSVPRLRASPAITILKPVCGAEPHLYENLRSFCLQDYPSFQIVFGVRDAADPALAVIRRLIEELPERDLSVVIDSRVIGRNYKVSNLANAMRAARHDLIVMADSDTRVGPDYLRAIAAAFEDKAVGAVTCLYRGVAGEGRASALGAIYLNDWYMPSVLLATRLGRLQPCFGQTMAVRREVLNKIGGLDALKDHIADDYMLGQLVNRAGFRVAIAPTLIDNVVCETDLRALFRHELRWARTLRTVRPLSYPLTLLTDALPLSLLALVVSALSAEACMMFLAAVVLRLVQHSAARLRFGKGVPYRLWLVPYRDMITFAVRLSCFVGQGISWRGHRFTLKPSGQMIAVD
ncbi:MAG: glycosyltransferase [Alphaproteobacteria bacterium]|nr:glycosyltransferase [Alphaproteobacteria bacterium]